MYGGKAVLISAYGPHGGHPYEDRYDFFSTLSDLYSRISSHGAKIVIGDLNARVVNVQPGEEHVVGPFLFGNQHSAPDPLSNRNLLVHFLPSA